MKPSIMYLHPKDEPNQTLETWPEIGTVEIAESESSYIQNFGWGGPFETHHRVASIQSGDVNAFKYLAECVKGLHVVAVRGLYENFEFMTRVQAWADAHAIVVCEFDRHSVMAALGRKAFWDGIELLQIAAEYIRGPAVAATDEAMRTETTLTRAIEALCKTGYHTPKR